MGSIQRPPTLKKGESQKARKEAFPFTNGKTFETSNYTNKSALKIFKGNMKKKNNLLHHLGLSKL